MGSGRAHHRLALSILMLTVVVSACLAAGAEAQTAPSGETVIAWHVTIAPTWFDPSTAPPQITPFGLLYALHDSVVRPLPGGKTGPSLAESWSESADGLTYEFKLRKGLKFHNGDPLTSEDVKWSLERYKGAGSREIHDRLRAIEIVDPLTVRIRLKEAWPDFMTFYGTTATAAGIVVPKKYMTQVGDDGFKKHPIGVGPLKFVSFKPGVEIVLEANTAYWRKSPTIKRFVLKSVPEGTTRVAMLKNGEADITYAQDGEDALNIRRDSRLQLVPSKHASIFWIEFAEQWDSKSPWHDKRMRLALNHSLNRKAINEVSCLGFCPPAATIVPSVMDFALKAPPAAYDPQKGKQLLAEAGYPNGIDAGDFVPIPPFFTTAELAVNDMNAIGIRVKMRTIERATFYSAWREKKLRGLFMVAAGNSGNAASRVAEFMYSKGGFAYGGYPDIDDLFHQQSRERDRAKREALLHKIQQLTIDRAMFAPIMDYRTLRGVGPRIAEHALDTMPLNPHPAYEDMKLKN